MLNILKSKKGSALLQVLVVSIIIATIAVFMLRIALARSSTVARGTALITARAAVEDCQQEVNEAITCFDNNPSNQYALDTSTCNALRARTQAIFTVGLVDNEGDLMQNRPLGTYRCDANSRQDHAGAAVQVLVGTNGTASPNTQLIFQADPVRIEQAM